jgi:phosphatidylglycerol:prolipoprotein diacylglycerol transferase
MHPFLIDTEILGLKIVIMTGSIFTVLAVLAGGFIYLFLLPDRKQWGSHLIFLAVVAVGALAGGKITQFVIDLFIFKDSNPLLVFVSSGSTVAGGILGAVAAALGYRIFDRKKTIGSADYDALSIAFMAGEALMRIGCLWNGCCFGAVCDPSPLALTYPPDWIMFRFFNLDVPAGPRLPFPLIASAALLLLGAALFLVNRRFRRPGLAAALFFILYGVYRFLIEFIRDEPFRLFLGPFSFAQWFALACLAAGTVLCAYVSLTKPPAARAAPERESLQNDPHQLL